jgi:hypothetical protein
LHCGERCEHSTFHYVQACHNQRGLATKPTHVPEWLAPRHHSQHNLALCQQPGHCGQKWQKNNAKQPRLQGRLANQNGCCVIFKGLSNQHIMQPL